MTRRWFFGLLVVACVPSRRWGLDLSNEPDVSSILVFNTDRAQSRLVFDEVHEFVDRRLFDALATAPLKHTTKHGLLLVRVGDVVGKPASIPR